MILFRKLFHPHTRILFQAEITSIGNYIKETETSNRFISSRAKKKLCTYVYVSMRSLLPHIYNSWFLALPCHILLNLYTSTTSGAHSLICKCHKCLSWGSWLVITVERINMHETKSSMASAYFSVPSQNL